MARASSTISVAITGDSRKLQGAIKGADKSMQGFAGSVRSAGGTIIKALAGVFAVSKGFEFLQGSIEQSDRLGDSVANLNRIVGKVNTKKIEQAADDFLKLGLSSADVLELSVGFARIAKAIGLRPKMITKYADDVAAVGQALALVDEKGRSAAQWVEIIGKAAAIPNARKPLQALGITISEAGVIKQALEQTGKATADQLTKAELSSARFLAIMRKLKTVIPEALANPDVELKQAQLQARIEELQGKIGMGLQPVIADLLQNIIDISESEWVDDLVKGIEVLQGKHDVPIFEDLKLGILTVQTTWDVLVRDLGEGWQVFMDATGLAGTTFDGLVTDLEEGWQVIVDATQPFIDALASVPEHVYAIGDVVGSVFGDMLTPLAKVADALRTIISLFDTGQQAFQTSTGRTPRGSPGSGNGDRNTYNSWRRENDRNGTPLGDP